MAYMKAKQLSFFFQQAPDIQDSNNYMGIKLPSHTLKVWERVIEMKMRMRRGVSISN